MILNLQKIINAPGERMEFGFDLDLSGVDFGGLYPIQSPVVVAGEVRNTAGMLTLEMEMSTVLKSVCDRCMKEFDNPKRVMYQCLLDDAPEEENDEIVPLVNHTLDAGELVPAYLRLPQAERELLARKGK